MKINFKKPGAVVGSFASTALPLLLTTNLVAQELEHSEPNIEEMIVTSTLHRSRADTAMPVNILTGEELREKVAATLGEMLQDQVGVTTASFGVGVGSPVIRGQGGNRVQVLQGGVGNIDASAISADHANSLEPALAERIEVIRGPATLLYGNGAIGGVVNVIDNRIPTSVPAGVTGIVESRYNSVSDQQVTVGRLEGGAGNIAWHLDGVYRESNDVEIPGFAVNPKTVDIADEEELEELLESRGRISNSSTRADTQTFGASWVFDEGYIGFSVNRLENEYGIPGHGHGHEDEHEDEDHDEDHDEEEHEGEEHDDEHGEEEGGVRIAMKQERADIEMSLPLSGWFEELHGRMTTVDYQHAEVEPDGEIGTLFEQDGIEGRFVLHLAGTDTREGVIGAQFSQREFSAIGEEAFVPETDIDSLALFTLHSINTGDLTYEFGLRGERQSMDQSGGSCDSSNTSWSGSTAAIWRFTDQANLLFSIAHSQRSATVEELYSNISLGCAELPTDLLVEHAATQRFEIGLPNADVEKSTNFEVGYRKHMGEVHAEVNVYYNDISDYIFLFDTGVFEDEVEISRYQQNDALFYGMEAEVNFPVRRSGDHLTEISLFGDYVRADFDNSGDVPRIPPLSVGFELQHSHVNWQTKLRWTEMRNQSDIGIGETRTNGYSLLNFYADYHLPFTAAETLFFFKANNLLDEEIRHHTSLLKDLAPAPGRAFEIGLRVEF
jgi:iron complex outermembrane receptor protein